MADDLIIRPYQPADEVEVVALWQQCDLIIAGSDSVEDIRAKLAVQPELFLVGVIDARVAATVMAGYEGHRGWVNYVAVAPERRRQGIGRRMMAAAETGLRALGCPKINLQVRVSNADVVAFYEHLGFSVEARISMGKRLR